MAGGCANLPIIRVCHRATLFDLDAMRMFGSAAQTERGTQTVQSARWLAGNRRFKSSVCTINWQHYPSTLNSIKLMMFGSGCLARQWEL